MSPPKDAALISVTDFRAPEASLVTGWTQVHRLSFDDVDPVDYPVDPEEKMIPMSDEQALELAGFVMRAGLGCRRLVVHCRYGTSRSAAIAKAVCERHDLYFPPGYSDQNDFVYRAVVWALSQQQGEA
jgi:predicted protein tyrosine phosphatase